MYSIQFAGALSLTLCPGAPKVEFSIGRPPPIAPAPNFIIPQPVNTTDELLAAFASVGFSPQELIALLSSHSVAGADDFSPPLQGYASVIKLLNDQITHTQFSVFHLIPHRLLSTVRFLLSVTMNDYNNCFLSANIFIDVLLNGTLFPHGA